MGTSVQYMTANIDSNIEVLIFNVVECSKVNAWKQVIQL